MNSCQAGVLHSLLYYLRPSVRQTDMYSVLFTCESLSRHATDPPLPGYSKTFYVEGFLPGVRPGAQSELSV